MDISHQCVFSGHSHLLQCGLLISRESFIELQRIEETAAIRTKLALWAKPEK